MTDGRRIVPHPRDILGCGSFHMQDIFWIGLTLILLASSLGYAALCGRA
ncbi:MULTISPECIES: hypothetical protein [Sphingobium]|nr:hypothetical protein [Sphingobium sp. 15-1]